MLKLLRYILLRDIATAPIGPRSVIATGPEEIQECKWELELDMENFIQAAEVRSGEQSYAFLWV